MPKFKYKAKKADGKIYEDTFEGKDRFEIYNIVHEDGSTIVSIKEEKESSFGNINVEKINILMSRIKPNDKIIFAKTLSSMLEAGLSLSRGILVMEKQIRNPKFKHVIGELKSEVEKGNSFSDSLAKFPKVFSSLFVSMVGSGEESGKLSEALKTVADQMERSYTLKKKIRGAMIYPSIIIIALIAVGVLMMIFVVPTLAETFKELNTELPASTQFIIGLSDFLTNNLIFAIAIVLGIVIGIYGALQTSKGVRSFEYIILHIPLISTLVKEINSARTARTMASLLASGVGMVKAISITKDVLQNSYYKDVLTISEERIQKGEKISEVFGEHENLYPIMVTEMIAVGEETGKLSSMFLEVANFYEEEVSQKTKNMSTVIEPFMMIAVGVGVGFFAVSMISPIYSISESI